MENNPAIAITHGRSDMHARRSKVLIVGAGLGGLTLGMLSHKANIPFEIYERATQVKPLGSAMYFNCTTANLFKQCGIYDEFVALGKYVSSVQMCNEGRQVEFSLDFDNHEKDFGANGYIIPRPQLYDLLLRQIPKERIHLGKKVLSMEHSDDGVMIRCSDGTEVNGDILVGADGAYSAVRKSLYDQLAKAKKLPHSDSLPLPFSTVCLVAQTRPLSPEEFPDLALKECQFRNTIGTNKMYAWATLTTAQNTVCFGATLFLPEEAIKDNDTFRTSEWGQESAAEMCDQIKDFPIISGNGKEMTLKDLLDRTPKEQISRVMLEEKVFETWYSGRTVLLGDACHKFNPQGGVGATNAMHDAVVLANLINGLSFHPRTEEIETAFKAYRDERFQWVQEAFDSSKVHRTMVGQERSCSYRPQVGFLPLVEDTGRVRPAPQPSLLIGAPVQAARSSAV
ncbi:hypothetical protein BGW39_011311 [Mortierella sp. 14UC]|nr:hypothetical protein BGW39_011311 [Mortierella sp. 14UC]